MVVLTGTPVGDTDERCLTRGREHVRHLVRIARELTDAPVEPPRLYVVTRNAQTVLSDDRANLDQRRLRGLMRVIGAEQIPIACHPDRRGRRTPPPSRWHGNC